MIEAHIDDIEKQIDSDNIEKCYTRYVFLDVVNYTYKRTTEAQSYIIKILNKIVSSILNSMQIESEDYVLLPTGDGLCIAIINPKLPLDIHMQISLKILEELSFHNDIIKDKKRKFGVRIGLNENHDNIIIDINSRKNVAGKGINMAARIMGLGDAGHIMLSTSVYETLSERELYYESFEKHSPKIKHGTKLDVYQFTQEGNVMEG
jgi:hypothetical protein